MSYQNSDPERMAEISDLLNNGMGENLTREELIEAVRYFAVRESLAYGEGQDSVINPEADRLCEALKTFVAQSDLVKGVRKLVGEWRERERQCRENAEGWIAAVVDRVQGSTFKIVADQLESLLAQHPEGREG